MLSIANTNSTAKIVLFPEEKENKSTKRIFFPKITHSSGLFIIVNQRRQWNDNFIES